MKKFISTSLAALLGAGTLMIASTDADANGRHWHRGGRVGVFIGAPVVVSPWWYGPRPYYGYAPYPYSYPYYGPVVREEPTTYIEQSTPDLVPIPQPAPQAQAPQQQQYWYFCQDTKTYYPHVQTCASPWQRVIPHAPQ